MDWNAAIEKNREALKRILAMLVAMAGLADGPAFTSPLWGGRREASGGGDDLLATPTRWSGERRPLHKGEFRPTLPRHLHRAVLRLLRPAEAAVRRLVIVAARGLVATLPPARPRQPESKPGPAYVPISSENLALRAPSLPLLDPLPRWGVRSRPAASGVPRISVPGFTEPFPVRVPSPDDAVDATRLALRLAALASVLDDLPGQARRFARWRVRRDVAGAQNKEHRDAVGAQDRNRDAASAQARQGRHKGRPLRLWPLRPGRPPGGRRRPAHEIHEVLNVVHGLAFWALTSPDTS